MTESDCPLNPKNLQLVNQLLDTLTSLKEVEPFLDPVDFEKLGIYDYPKIIKKMMDFKTIRENLNEQRYETVRQVLDDVQLIWDNCKLYNLEYSKIHKISLILEGKTKKEVHKLFGEIEYGENNPSYFELQKQLNSKFYEDEINFTEKIELTNMIKAMSPKELTKVVELLNQICQRSLKESEDKQQMEILVDNITKKAFEQVKQEITRMKGQKKIKEYFFYDSQQNMKIAEDKPPLSTRIDNPFNSEILPCF